MRHLGVRFLLGWATVAGVVAGCDCGGPGPIESEYLVRIESPLDAQRVRDADDVDPATPGIQIDVVVTGKDSKGKRSELESVTLEHRLASETEFQAVTITPAVEGDKATYPKFTVAPGSHVFRANGTEKGTSRTAESGPITITVESGKDTIPPRVTEFAFQGDANGDRKLNLQEQSTGQPVALLTIADVEDGRPVTVRDSSPFATVYGTGTTSGGKATVALSQLPAAPEASYTLVAEVTDAAGNKNQITGSPVGNPEAFTTLRVDRIAPSVAMVAPTKNLFGLADDADTQAADFQLRVTAQSASTDLAHIVIAADGKTAPACGAGCLSTGTATVTLSLTASGTRATKIQATAFDDSGNAGPASSDVVLDFDPPVVNITSPVAANNPHTQFAQQLRAQVSDPGGRPVNGLVVRFLRKSGATEVSLDQGTTDAQGVATGAFTFSNGTYDLVARVADTAANEGSDQETGVVIQGTGCDLTVTAPLQNPSYLTRTNDADQLRADLQYTLRVRSNACPNAAVLLSKCTSQSSCSAASTPFLDPAETAAKFTDVSGNANWRVTMGNGAHLLKAEIANVVGGPTPVFIDLNVDLTTPSITFPISGAVLRVANDVDRTTAGVQAQLSFTATVPTGGRVDVCYNTTTPRQGDTACATGVSGWWTLKSNVTSPDNTFTYPDSPPAGYAIIPVVVSSGGTNAGAPISLTVDSIRPRTTAVTIVGDANGDKRLSTAELNGQNPRLTVVTSEPAGILVKDRTSGTSYTTGRVQTGSGNTVTVELNQNVTSTEADYDLVIDLQDAVGNGNVQSNPTTADPLDALAFQTLRVDKQAPSCAFTAPTKKTMGPADDADAAAGYQVRAAVSTANDVGNNGVVFNLTGAQTTTATVTASNGAATHLFTVPSTGTNAYSLAATCTDAAGNSANATLSLNPFTVDLEAPTCTLTAPTAGTYGTFALTTTVSVGGVPDGTAVNVFTTPNGGSRTQQGALTVASGSATGSITYPNGAQSIEAEVTDAAGNLCTTTPVAVTVNAVGCPISVTAPTSNSFLNKSNDLTPGTVGSLEVNVVGSSTNCAGRTVTIYRSGSPRTQLATGTTDGSSNFSIQISLLEGVTNLEAEIDNGSAVMTTTTITNLTVDLTDPAVVSVSPTGTSLFVVADGNLNLRPPANAAYIKDATPGGPGDFNVTLTNVTGAVNGSVRVLFNGSTVGGPVVPSSDPQSFTIPVSVAHGVTGPFVVEVRDQAGNMIRPTNASSMAVDVLAPASPTLGQTLSNARAATVNLAWTAVYDDGSDSSSGAVTSYDVRWTSNAIKVAGGGQTTGMTADDYFDSSKVKAESLLGGATTTHSVTLPPISTYYIAVRAVDEVGNYSAFVSPTGLPNAWTTTVLTNPDTAGGNYGAVVAANGSLNNDAVADLVVGASSTNNGVVSGAVYVYYGGSGLTAQTTCVAPSCQKLVTFDATTATGNFGTDVSIGNIGDLAGEQKPDLVVSSSTWASNTGRVLIFVGTSSAGTLDASSPIEIRGNSGSTLGTAAQVIPDINNDGLSELAVTSMTETSTDPNRGKVFIFKGRTVASWIAASTQTDGAGKKYIPISAADWTVSGPLPVSQPGGNRFGMNRGGFTSVGDLDNDGRPEFTIPNSKDSNNKMYLFSGADVTMKVNLETGESPVANDAYQVLAMTPGTLSTRYGFSHAASGLADLIGSTARDLAVADPSLDRVHLFGGGAATFPSAPTHSIQGVGFFGWTVAPADVNGDGRQDLLVGEFNATIPSSAWVFYSRNGSLDTGAGTGFAQSRLQSGAATSALGVGLAVGDFNGDGLVDIAAGDTVDGPGKVTIWR